MPTENATRFEVAVYVEPEHVETFKTMVDRSDDDSILLDFEKVIGARLANNGGPINLQPAFGGYNPNYGVGVAEVYVEGDR